MHQVGVQSREFAGKSPEPPTALDAGARAAAALEIGWRACGHLEWMIGHEDEFVFRKAMGQRQAELGGVSGESSAGKRKGGRFNRYTHVRDVAQALLPAVSTLVSRRFAGVPNLRRRIRPANASR